MIIHKWETFKTADNFRVECGHPSKFTPRSKYEMLKDNGNFKKNKPTDDVGLN